MTHEEASRDTVRAGPHRSVLLLIALAGALVISAAAAHSYIARQPISYSGPLLFLDHVFTAIIAFVLLSICTGAGRHLLVRLRFEFDRPIDELAFATVVGAVVISVSLLICGLLALFLSPVIGAVLLLWAIVSHREILSLPSLWARSAAQLKDNSGGRAYAILSIGILGLVFAVLIIQAVAPASDWDSLMYHLQIPQQFLQEGRIFVPEDNLHVAYVGLIHMLYAPLLALGSPSAPAVLSVLFALLLGLALFSLGTRFFSGPTASLSLTTLWATTSILLVAITPRLDVTLALYLFIGQYALLIALSDPQRVRYFYLAAFVLGSAIGVKYNSLAYVLALSPLVFWIGLANGRGFRRSLKPLALFGLLGIAAALPWLVKNWILLDTPLYPFFSETILPPWLAAIYGTKVLPAGIDPQALRAIASARLPFNLIDLFTAPGRLTVEQEGAHYHMNLLYLLLPLSVLFFRNKVLNWLVLPAVVYLVLILVPFPATNLRYLIPSFAPLTIAAAFIADRVSHRMLSAEAARLLLISLAVLSLFPSAKATRFWLLKSDIFGYLAGTTSQQEYLETGFYLYSQLLGTTNRLVPSDGKVLLLFEARGYYFRPQVIQDNMITNWTLLAPKLAGSDACLETTDISHVLVNDLAVGYYVRRGTDPQSLQINSLPNFARRCLTMIHRGQGFILFSLNPSDVVPAGQGEASE